MYFLMKLDPKMGLAPAQDTAIPFSTLQEAMDEAINLNRVKYQEVLIMGVVANCSIIMH